MDHLVQVDQLGSDGLHRVKVEFLPLEMLHLVVLGDLHAPDWS